MRHLLFLAMLAGTVNAQSGSLATSADSSDRWQGAWKYSLAASTAALSMDVATSYGHQESDALLRPLTGPHFAARGVAIGAGLALGNVFAQRWLVRRWPGSARTLTFVNAMFGGLEVGTAAHNLSLH